MNRLVLVAAVFLVAACGSNEQASVDTMAVSALAPAPADSTARSDSATKTDSSMKKDSGKKE